MHSIDPSPTSGPSNFRFWWQELNSYHWFVLIIAALGWLFDTMDQQIFVLAKTPALMQLLDIKDLKIAENNAKIDEYGKYATAIFMIGWAIGGLLFGVIGDRWGRAKTIMATVLIYSLFTGLSALSHSWLEFAFYRFITGMGVGGEFAAGVSLVAEVMPSAARPYALGLLQALSAVGNMTAAIIGLVVHPRETIHLFNQDFDGWRLMFCVGTIPALLVLLVMRKLKEPQTWIDAKKRAAEGGQDSAKLGSISELFRHPTYRFNTIIGFALASIGVLLLWGVGFWLPELLANNILKEYPAKEKDMYIGITQLLLNFGAFFGVYGFSLLAGRFGRRMAFALAYTFCFLGIFIVFGFMNHPSQIYWMVPLFGFCILMPFGGFAVYFPELFPTRLRSTGVSICYNLARLATALLLFLGANLVSLYSAPANSDRALNNLSSFTWLSSIGGIDNPFRYACITIGAIFLISYVVLFFAPETKGKPLPD